MAQSCKRMRTPRAQPITGMALQISSLPNMQARPHSRTPALQTAVTDASYSHLKARDSAAYVGAPRRAEWAFVRGNGLEQA
jgi:hypothetical protein